MLVARDIGLCPPGEPGRRLIEGLSLRVAAGEWVALSGPNGCGKTLLALALAGLRPIQGGSLELDGEAFGPATRSSVRKSVAVVLQDPSSQLLQPTVREELVFAARNLGVALDVANAQAAQWVEDLGLDQELERDPRTLSAGRQQLALIAAAMIARPKLLILDEPGAHLDPSTRARVIERIRREVSAGLAVVWVTQIEAERVAADRVVTFGPAVTPTDRSLGGQVAVGQRGTGEPEGAFPSLVRIDLSGWDGSNGPHVVLDGPMTLNLPSRGVTALEGPNGSGKSVVLGAIGGVLRTSQIRLTWAANPGSSILTAQYPELQIFEEWVRDEVIYAAVRRGKERHRALLEAAESFQRLGLGGERFLCRRVWDLSSGEKRAVLVVGALIAPASLVLLDEPTCGLDDERREGLGHLVRARAERDSILIASQDGDWLRSVDARVLRLCEPGSTCQVAAKKRIDR